MLTFILIAAALLLFGANVFANAGKSIVTNRILGAGTEPKYIAWGTGAGSSANTDTTLFTEASEARTGGTSSQQTTTVTGDTYQVIGTMTVAGTGKTITNAGLFDNVTPPGNMLVKGDFTGIALAVGESIAFTFKLSFA
jgi:hypothetical protein